MAQPPPPLRSVPRTIRFVTVHHCAAYDTKQHRVVHQTVEQIRAYHMRPIAQGGRGFKDIGYHRFVERDGTLQLGRKDSEIPAAIEGFNPHILAICASGHGDFEPFNPEQLTTIINQCAAWVLEHSLPIEHVIGHREADDFGSAKVWKTCPGMRNDLDQLRERVRSLLHALP